MSKKVIKNFCFILILFFILIIGFFLYFSIPSEIILPEDSNLEIDTIPIGSFHAQAVYDSGQPVINNMKETLNISSSKKGEYGYDYRLFNTFRIKEVDVSVVPKRYVVPSGETIGVKMYTDGLLVVKVSSVLAMDGVEYFPAKDAGICEGDRIISVDGIRLNTNEEIADYVNKVKGSISAEIVRGDESLNVVINPVLSKDNLYKIGMWVRDSTAGIGTLTYYNPQSGEYAALGHAITDSDTGSILTVSKGSLIDCTVVSVTKGERGVPGELAGSFTNNEVGNILNNNEFGIFGCLDDEDIDKDKNAVEIATRFQIKEGDASILCDVDGKGVMEYDVEIVKISKDPKPDNKGIVVEVTDNGLLEKTGGIVQGMSGSPIIQNGKLVGAVTHVFVNDPTKGYGIFIENMLAEAVKK